MIVNNPFAMVVMIVAIVMLTSVVRTYLKNRGPADDALRNDAEKEALIREVKELKERLHTLERITVDKENSLSRQIEELRDK